METGISSNPGAELFIEKITEIISSSDISGMITLSTLLFTYNRGFILECLLLTPYSDPL